MFARLCIAASTIAFDLLGGTLGVLFYFASGATLAVPAGKQLNILRWVDTITLGALSTSKFIAFELIIDGDDASDAYGVIGKLTSKGGGEVKSGYFRAKADPGCRGVVVGAVSAVETRAGVQSAAGHEISLDSADETPVDHAIRVHKNSAGVVNAKYGLLYEMQVAFANAVLQAFAGGVGDFLRWMNAAGTDVLFRVNNLGEMLCKGLVVNGVSAFNSTVQLGSQVSLAFANSSRQFYLQAVSAGDYWRILASGVGDVLRLYAGGLLQAMGAVHANYGTAPPSGGSCGVGFPVSNRANLGVFVGAGAPTFAAAKNAGYINADATGMNDWLYRNTADGVNWTAATLT